MSNTIVELSPDRLVDFLNMNDFSYDTALQYVQNMDGGTVQEPDWLDFEQCFDDIPIVGFVEDTGIIFNDGTWETVESMDELKQKGWLIDG